jgi:hypothetical protein
VTTCAEATGQPGWCASFANGYARCPKGTCANDEPAEPDQPTLFDEESKAKGAGLRPAKGG